MTHVIRFANSASFESPAPYAMPIERSASDRSGNGNSNFFANAAFSSGVSKEMPQISAFFFLNSG